MLSTRRRLFPALLDGPTARNKASQHQLSTTLHTYPRALPIVAAHQRRRPRC